MHNAQVCYIPRRAPPPRRSFPFSSSVLYPVDPPPPPLPPVLPIFHFGSLPRRPGPSHFPLRFFNLSIPPAGPWHFPLRFCNLSIPISHFDYLTRRSPRPEHMGITKKSNTHPTLVFCLSTTTVSETNQWCAKYVPIGSPNSCSRLKNPGWM